MTFRAEAGIWKTDLEVPHFDASRREDTPCPDGAHSDEDKFERDGWGQEPEGESEPGGICKKGEDPVDAPQEPEPGRGGGGHEKEEHLA